MDISQTGELASIRDWVRWGASRFNEAGLFFGHGTDNALDEALALVLHALKLDHGLPEAFLDCQLTAGEKYTVFDFLQQRVEARIPAAYITQKARFSGLSFYVNDSVLVPRSPIAELVLQGFQPWLPHNNELHILDLCTGSGCIGIACAHYLSDVQVDISDVSAAALDVARVNVEQHQMEDRVNIIQSDLFDNLPVAQYDLIVSNPPYVSIDEMQQLPEEYLQEPSMGLQAGVDGMEIVARILCTAAAYLKPNGILIVEVGASANHLLARYPDVAFLWLDFEQGGDGVFLLTTAQLEEYKQVFLEECSQ